MSTFHLRFLEADQPFFEGDCVSLIFPAPDGQYGVQAHHRNLIAAIVPGTVTLRLPDGSVRLAAVSAGMIKIENNEVLILADSAERPEDIDMRRAERAAARAKEKLMQEQNLREHRLAQAELARAINRLNVGSRR